MADKTLPCIRIKPGEIPPRVLTCGDPARAERIAGMLDGMECLMKNREFWTFTGRHHGVEIAVVSHGVGAGGAAIAFESLWRAGARVIIRVGTCGGMQDGIDAGSIIIVTAAAWYPERQATLARLRAQVPDAVVLASRRKEHSSVWARRAWEIAEEWDDE